MFKNLTFFFLFVSFISHAQNNPEVINLWPNGAPGFEHLINEKELAKDWWVKNVHNPSITVFRPATSKANGVSVVIFPDGGYRENWFMMQKVVMLQNF